MGRLFLVGAVALAVACLGIALWSANRTSAPTGAAPASGIAADQLEDLRHPVAELEATSSPRPPDVADAAASSSDADATATGEAVPAPDVLDRIRRLETRLEELELRNAAYTESSALTDAEVLDRARSLAKEGKDPAAARDAWRTLLDRGPTPEVRDEALFGLGVAAREAGKYDEAEQAFRELTSLAGEGSARSAEARYQLAWGESRRNRHDAAAREMEAVAENAHAPPTLRAHALTNGAYFALQAGDEARARALLGRAIADFADSPVPALRGAVTRAREMLADLDER